MMKNQEKMKAGWMQQAGGICLDLAFVLLLFSCLAPTAYYCPLIASCLLLLHNLLYSFTNIRRHIIFLLFSMTFAFFLLSRFIVVGFFGMSYNYSGLYEMGFTTEISRNMILWLGLSLFLVTLTYVYLEERAKEGEGWPAVSLALLVLFLGQLSLLFHKPWGGRRTGAGKDREGEREKRGQIHQHQPAEERREWQKTVRQIALLLFYVSIFCRIFFLIRQGKMRADLSYRQFFVDKEALSGSMRVVDIIGRMSYASFFVYLACLPGRRRLILPCTLFLLASGLELRQGYRNPIALNLLLLLSYFLMIRKEGQAPRFVLPALLIALPLLLFLFIKVGYQRGTADADVLSGTGNRLLRFFYEQGVSARTIGNAQLYQERIPYRFYSLGEPVDFFLSLFSPLWTGHPFPSGQSLAVVESTHQLSHLISYLQSPFDYLNLGVGTGSSYVAELYIDLGLPGIILGSVFYGWLIHWMVGAFYSDRLFLRLSMLLMARDFFFTPRSSFSHFLSPFLEKTQLLTLFLIFLSACLLCQGKKRTIRRKEGGYD